MIRRLFAALFPPSNIKRLVGVDHLGNKYYEIEKGMYITAMWSKPPSN